ncbi:TRAP transporter large permease [Deinococcus roseus]|uniref:C4-dicarboxylate ABC transporter n=1 Tax=Deinococcus roseus TaxID=392414 RepID=A0ABQ2D0C4_9DEIO|nr:TRAP transporter large permease subunit [Deinococcus roseus]GGJ33808.1 C4-dicarboxylate ABC transporter [Deinococcus roseus]
MDWGAILPPAMFVSLIVFLLLGYPVAFSIGAVGLLFGFIGVELDVFKWQFLSGLPLRITGTMFNQTLLAIPFFTFMGLILERSGMAEELLDTMGQLFGKVRGGLAYAVIFVGALLAATTGVVAASVIAMGLISLPIMMRYGYSTRLATGVIAASGTLAQIIPPSLVLIVMADQLGASVGDMYRGAMVPGLILTGMYVLYVLITTIVNPKSAPALPEEARKVRGFALFLQAMRVMVPPLVLIFLVLGTIFFGLATPTEGGAMGAVGAIILAMLNKRLSYKLLWQAMQQTASLTTFVVFILLGSTVFSLVFQGVYGSDWVDSLMTSIPGGKIGFLIFVNIFVFMLAFFLDFFEIAFIVIPLLKPVMDSLGISPYYFGVLIGVNLQTSFMHPPFGFALFYLRSVAPKNIKTIDIYWGAVPFVVIQVIMVGLLIAFPVLVLRWIQ